MMDADYDKALGNLRPRTIVLLLEVDTTCIFVLEYPRCGAGPRPDGCTY
jgi:hypothetical protein